MDTFNTLDTDIDVIAIDQYTNATIIKPFEVIPIDEEQDVVPDPPAIINPLEVIPIDEEQDVIPEPTVQEIPAMLPLVQSPRKRKWEQMEAEAAIEPIIESMIDLSTDNNESNDSNTNNKEPEALPVAEPPAKRRKLSKMDPNLSTLTALSQTRDFSDITFKVGDTDFFGLKAIFAIKSAVFQELLYPVSGEEVRCIAINDISVEAFVFIRDFFYDLNPQLSFQNVVSVLNASKIYDIELIQNQCNAFLHTIDNVDDLLSVLKQFGNERSLENELNQLLENNTAILQNNGTQIIESDTFKSFPFFMAKRFIESDALGVKEEDLWNNTKQWLPTNAEELKQIIRFCRMDTEFIFNQVKISGVLNDGDLVSIYEKKLELNTECRFNCNERFVVKVKRTRSRRKKKEEVEDGDEEPQKVSTPKKKGRGRSKSRAKSAGRGRSKTKKKK